MFLIVCFGNSTNLNFNFWKTFSFIFYLILNLFEEKKLSKIELDGHKKKT